MNALVIFAPSEITAEHILDRLTASDAEFEELCINAAVGVEGDRLYWQVDPEVLNEYGPTEQDAVVQLGEAVRPWVLHYSQGIRSARVFLGALAEEFDIWVDVDFGPERLIPPAELRDLLLREPAWDWRLMAVDTERFDGGCD